MIPPQEQHESLVPIGSEEAERKPAGSSPAGMSGFELRPHTVGEVLDVAVDVFCGRFLAFVGLGMLLLAPRALYEHWFHTRYGIVLPEDMDFEWLGATFAGQAFFALSMMLVSAASAVLAFSHLQGRRDRLGDVAGIMLRRFPHVLAVSFLVVLMAGLPLFGGVLIASFLLVGLLSTGSPVFVPLAAIGALFAIVPGLLLYWRMLLASTVVVLERCGPVVALQRSWDLTRGMLPRGVGVLVLGFVCFLPVTAWTVAFDDPDLRASLRQTLSFAPVLVSELALLVPGLILDALSVSFWGVLLVVFYVECRVRREAFDIAIRLRRRVDSSVPAKSGAAGMAGAVWTGRA